MADRHWVGGTASWDGTAGSKWSLTAGGAGGQAVPTASDDVYLDASSGSNTVTIVTATAACLSLICTGFTGTLAGSTAMTISASLTMGSGMTWNYTGAITFNATGTGKTITSNGVTIKSSITFNGSGGGWTLSDDYTSTTTITLTLGTFVTAGFTVTVSGFFSTTLGVRTLTLSTSTIVLTGAGTAWNFSTTTNLAASFGSSTIKFTNSTSSINTFAGGNKTYGTVWFNRGTSTGGITITGNNTISTWKDDGTVAHTYTMTQSSTQTVTTFTVNGTVTAALTFVSSSPGTQWGINKTSGTINMTYTSLTDSLAGGGATWNADATCTNGGHNTGWNFTTVSTKRLTMLGVG